MKRLVIFFILSILPLYGSSKVAVIRSKGFAPYEDILGGFKKICKNEYQEFDLATLEPAKAVEKIRNGGFSCVLTVGKQATDEIAKSRGLKLEKITVKYVKGMKAALYVAKEHDILWMIPDPTSSSPGIFAGEITNTILTGGSATSKYTKSPKIVINKKTAQKLGISIPDTVIKKAAIIYE